LENGDQLGPKLFADIEQILGIDIGRPKIPANIKRKAEERESYRNSGNFKKADQLREQIESSGYQLKDREEGFEIWPKTD
jgi:cysteinyl-tRNA synthetase